MILPLHSLRTGILAQLTFLIVAAMLLINLVSVKFSERDLLRARIETARPMIFAIEQALIRSLAGKGGRPADLDSDSRLRKEMRQLLLSGGFSGAFAMNRQGERFLTMDLTGKGEGDALLLARKAMEGGTWITDLRGMVWGVIWISPGEMNVSAPLSFGEALSGGITIRASLTPIYETLRETEKLVLLYIFLDTLILVIVGLILLNRIVVNPIHRLLKMTAEYKGGDMIPALSDTSRNEIGELTRSLNVMLKRLNENKEELKAHIASLEEANRELQQAQNEILKSEKLASVGRLAAGVAHEIGNPIGITLGYLDLLRREDVTGDERRDFLSRMESELTRVNRIIRDLLDFSRPSQGSPEKTRGHETLMNTLEVLRPQPMMGEIRIDLSLQAEEDTLLADPDQLQQVFLNIIMNAADALAESRSRGGSGEERRLTIGTRNMGRSIEFRFEDTGPGIPQDEIGRVFDPFYTTKEPGKGTGLGLAVCYRIVERLGGKIEIGSVLGKGTAICVTLPLHHERQEASL